MKHVPCNAVRWGLTMLSSAVARHPTQHRCARASEPAPHASPVMGIQLVYGCTLLYCTLGSRYTYWYHTSPMPTNTAGQAAGRGVRLRWSRGRATLHAPPQLAVAALASPARRHSETVPSLHTHTAHLR